MHHWKYKRIEKQIRDEGAEVVKGDCFFCGKEVDGMCYCFGCKEFICNDCDFDPLDSDYPSGLHTVEAHKPRIMPEEQDRLLTDEEMQNIRFNNPSPNAPRLPSYVRVIAQAQRTLTREATCKKIGKWLARKENTRPWGDDIFDLFLSDRDIEALKQGKLPQQGEE